MMNLDIKLKLLKFAHLDLELYNITMSNNEMRNEIKSIL